MALKKSGNIDELCYPFIYEASYLCDFEVATDELCNHLGGIVGLLADNHDDIATDLKQLQPLIYHLNGSIRGRLALEEADLQWLMTRYHHYQKEVAETINGFVLPRGPAPSPQLHLARSAAKKAIRLMVRIDQEWGEVPERLHRFCNLLCNFFFVLALVNNRRQGFVETAFVSKSYGRTRKRGSSQ